MVCAACPFWSYQTFDPIVAKVVDANGNPVPNTAVNWFVVAGNGGLATVTTYTDSNGLATNSYQATAVTGEPNQSFITSEITAQPAANVGSQAVFYETQALALQGGAIFVQVTATQMPSAVTGPAGSTGPTIQIVASAYNIPVQGVEVRLIPQQGSPSITCPTGTNADPGTVLTDATGTATCNPILSGSGNGYFQVLVGGVAVWSATGQPQGYRSYDNITLSVTAPSPGSITNPVGNNQSATAGQALGSPLTAEVEDINGNPIVGQAVTWTVTPSNAGTLAQSTTTSGNGGIVQNSLTLSTNANGSVTVTAAIASNPNIRFAFSVNAIPLVSYSSLTYVSGSSQTIASGQTFPNPLVVQVINSNGQPAVNVAVNFALTSGSAILSSSSPITNSTGQAQVTVTAGSVTTQTSVTVVASLGNLPSVTFALTVIPPGPVITASSFVNAADQKVGSISPCSLATVIGPGIAPNIQGTVVGTSFGPGPYSLASGSISFNGNDAAPIFSATNAAGQQSMTFQVPCDLTPSAALPVTVTVGGGTAQVNVPVLAASPGVFGALGGDGIQRATMVRADGSFVSLTNPARRGESVTAFVTGLGATSPQPATDQLPPRGTNSTVIGTVIPGIAGGGTTLNFAQLTPDLVGVFEVSFVIPTNVNPGNNVGFSVGLLPVGATTALYSKLIYVPVQ
jgi:uncharacterized protein (TIGR03437 family)